MILYNRHIYNVDMGLANIHESIQNTEAFPHLPWDRAFSGDNKEFSSAIKNMNKNKNLFDPRQKDIQILYRIGA